MMTRTALLALTLVAAGTASAQTTPATRPAATRPPATAAAPAATGLKIAYLNSRAILAQTPGYAVAETTFARELAASRTEVAKLQQSLDSAANDFETSSVLLSPSVKAERQRQLLAQQQSVQQRQQDLQGRMEQRERELLEPLQQRVQAVVEGVRAEMNYAVIFDVAAMGGAMVAADRSLDITQVVIQRLIATPGR
jgi:outer membrane protein